MNSAGEAAVTARDLTISFGGFKAVDGVSFSVAPGEIFGFLGANGAGKTTTIRILCGLLIPDSGEARVAGVDVRTDPMGVKARVGYMSQRFTLYNDLSIEENLDFAGRLHRMDEDTIFRRKKELRELAGLDAAPDALVRDLPPGIKQSVALAAATLHDPPVIFLDEPTTGVTPASRRGFWRLIRHLAGEGRAVFVTTHYMDEAEQCGRIALMRAGRIIALDSPEGLKRSAFPLPLIEIAPAPGAPGNWRERYFGDGQAGVLSPHGMRWHLAVKDAGVWEALVRELPPTLPARSIVPSLEDVFIRMVES